MSDEKVPHVEKRRTIFVTQQFRRFEDDYVLLDPVGEPGQFGTAWIAYKKRDPKKTRVCVKEINKSRFHHISLEGRQQVLQTMQNEIATLKRVSHENIVQLYDVYEDRHKLHLVMEYLPGGELFDRITDVDSFSETQAAHYLKQILSALDHMHDQHILHLDLKPENIIFESKDTDAKLKLIDFGMARVIPRLAQLKDRVGTVSYMAPEVFEGHYSRGADVWSAGIILYCMLFGYPPFYADENEILRFGEETIIEQKIRKGFCKEVKEGFGPWFPADIPVSENCMKLLSHMLESDVAKRWTVKECLSSLWIRGECHDTDISPKHKQALLDFRKTCKFKLAVSNYFANSLDADEVQDVKTFFSSLDENHDGVITLEEFKKGMKERDKRLTEAQIERMFQNIDIDDSRGITLDELLTACANRALIAQDERLFRAFVDLDKDENGTLSKQELEDALIRIDPSFKDNQEQLSTAFASADRNGDGKIDYEEFLRILHPEFREDAKLDDFIGGDDVYYAGENFDVVGTNKADLERDVSLLVPERDKPQFGKSISSGHLVVIDLNTASKIDFKYKDTKYTVSGDELIQLLEDLIKG